MAVSVDEAVSTGPVRDHTPPTRRFGGRGSAVLEVVLLAVLAVVMLFPVLWMIETSITARPRPPRRRTGWAMVSGTGPAGTASSMVIAISPP